MWKIIDRAKEMAPFCRASMLPYDDEKIFGRVYRALLNLQQV
jgi:hypothetical protein